MPAFRPRNLLGVLSFLKRYAGSVTLAVGMLLFNIGLEMTLPRIVERGAHESLLTAGGVYAGLHQEFSRHH